jgi:hypothetical protein
LFGFQICSDSKFSWLQNLFTLNFFVRFLKKIRFKIFSVLKFVWTHFLLFGFKICSHFNFCSALKFPQIYILPAFDFFQILCLISKFVQIQVLFGFVICSSLKTEDLIWLICCTKTEEDFIVLVLLIEWTNGLVHLFFLHKGRGRCISPAP